MVNNELNEQEKIILNYLEKNKKEVSVRKLSEKISLSYPTTLKYIGTLELKGKIELKNFGNVKKVRIKS